MTVPEPFLCKIFLMTIRKRRPNLFPSVGLSAIRYAYRQKLRHLHCELSRSPDLRAY